MTTNQTETKSVTAVLVYWELCFTRNCLIRGSSPFLFHQIVLKDENKFKKKIIYPTKCLADTTYLPTHLASQKWQHQVKEQFPASQLGSSASSSCTL